jgi:peptidoglycan/LPS O-acetylase OafA/YrhL
MTNLARPPQGKAHLPELTSMRFAAAMVVLLGHFAAFVEFPRWIAPMLGGYGVSFFFVLSGFILTYRYWDEFAAGVRFAAYRRYFAARVARVYPSYVLALLLITVLFAVIEQLRPGAVSLPGNTLVSWIVNLLALQTFAKSWATQQLWNGPAWSISTEFCFYALFPFILVLLARRASTLRALFAALAFTVAYGAATQAAILWLVIGHGWDRWFWLELAASRNIVWRLPEFLVGVIAARLCYGGHFGWLASRGVRDALLLAGLAGVVLLNYAPWPPDTQETAFLVNRHFRLDLGYMLPFACILVALAAGPTFATPVLARRAGVFLGEASYGIYIYHWIFWMSLDHYKAAGHPVSAGLVTAMVALTILFASASYAWFERPARNLIRSKLAQ